MSLVYQLLSRYRYQSWRDKAMLLSDPNAILCHRQKLCDLRCVKETKLTINHA